MLFAYVQTHAASYVIVSVTQTGRPHAFIIWSSSCNSIVPMDTPRGISPCRYIGGVRRRPPRGLYPRSRRARSSSPDTHDPNNISIVGKDEVSDLTNSAPYTIHTSDNFDMAAASFSGDNLFGDLENVDISDGKNTFPTSILPCDIPDNASKSESTVNIELTPIESSLSDRLVYPDCYPFAEKLNSEQVEGDAIEYSLHLDSDSEDFPPELETPVVEDTLSIFEILEEELKNVGEIEKKSN